MKYSFDLRYNSNTNLYELINPVEVEIFPDCVITIPAGYSTDWASVPSWLWSVIRPTGKAQNYASLIHDYLYDEGYFLEAYFGKQFARRAADMIFYYFLQKIEPEKSLRNWLMWAGVRLFAQGKFLKLN